MSAISRAFGTLKLVTKANAPTILVVSGVASMAAATVFAGRSTLRVEETLAKHKDSLELVSIAIADDDVVYSEEDARRDRIKVYTYASLDLVKLYSVPATLFAAGAALVFGGHRIMLKRNATLAVAFTTVNNAFQKYRDRVRELMGEETDQAIMAGTITPTKVDKNGKILESEAYRDWGSEDDPYARVFSSQTSSQWQDDQYSNDIFLGNQQRFAQQLLNIRGYLFLSEVYQALGFAENDISRVVGWRVRVLPDGSRDIPMVDFGLDKKMDDSWKRGEDGQMYLDFNCQGLIIGGKIQKILEAS